jgi:hypothetical protein
MRMRMERWLVVAVALAGCGGDDSAGAGDDTSEPAADASTDMAASLPDASRGDAEADHLAADAAGTDASGFQWRPLRVGAGGWLTGIDISADGSTEVVRTDTYGAYLWDSASSQWRQLVTATSMPSADVDVDNNAGVYEIRVAPHLATRLYMAYRGTVYRSDDRGASWARTAFDTVPMDANDAFRTRGAKMAVDPANPDVVYVGTPANGLFATTDGGKAWQSVATIPTSQQSGGAYPGITGMAFDGSSGQTSGRTNRVYASSYGNGVYTSADAGASWARTTGGPDHIRHAAVASDGVLYATDDDGNANNAWKLEGGTWTNLNAKGAYHSVAVDPANPARIVLGDDSGALNQSTDRGATWAGKNAGTRVATDVPWLAWTNESYMSNGDMMFDPSAPNTLWFSEGIGVWSTSPPAGRAAFAWTSRNAGIEQLVANVVVAPPGGRPIVGSWDRPVFYIADPDAYPKTHGPDNQQAIVAGWSFDYAQATPTFVAGLMAFWTTQKSGTSTDGGKTWTPFPSYPPIGTAVGGCIAVSTPSNIVWVSSDNGSAYYTKDGGATWSAPAIPGVPATGEPGWSFAYYLDRQIVAADRVTSGTFYLYNYLTGLYRSTDGGVTFALARAGELSPSSKYNAELRSVPGNAGHLFFTAGQLSGDNPAPSPLLRSADGGTTWTEVPNVLEVYTFGFGKEAPGHTYPAMFIVGWVGGVYGVWRSDDDAKSWTSLGAFPLGSLDQIKTIDGDKDTYAAVYVGFSGSGYAYGKM